MARLKLGLRNLSVSETILKGNSILFHMQNNPHFPGETNPPLSEVAACLSELKAAATNAMNRDKVMVSIRNDKMSVFIVLLRKLGTWISIQTTNKAAIISSGFEAIQRKGSKRQLSKPEKIKREFDSRNNILKVMWQPVPGARQYIVEVTQTPSDPNAQWSIAGYTSQAKYIPSQDEMKPLTPYYYRVRALGTKGMGPASSFVKAVIF